MCIRDRYKAVMGYKEAAGSGKAAFKVDRYYHSFVLSVVLQYKENMIDVYKRQQLRSTR